MTKLWRPSSFCSPLHSCQTAETILVAETRPPHIHLELFHTPTEWSARHKCTSATSTWVDIQSIIMEQFDSQNCVVSSVAYHIWIGWKVRSAPLVVKMLPIHHKSNKMTLQSESTCKLLRVPAMCEAICVSPWSISCMYVRKLKNGRAMCPLLCQSNLLLL